MDVGRAGIAGAAEDALENGVHEELGEELIEVIEAKLRPRFQGIAPGEKLGAIEKLQFGDHGLAFLHVIAFQLKHMYHAEMHSADFRGVVVQDGGDAVRIFRAEAEFFADFALDRGVVGGSVESEEVLILIIHVSADADGAFRDEPLFARFFSANVVEHAPFVDEHDVRNDLLQSGIRFGRAARCEEGILARKECGQITVHVEAQPLKGTELIEERAADDEDLFCFHRAVVARTADRAQPLIRDC